jgi:hypothetical protein
MIPFLLALLACAHVPLHQAPVPPPEPPELAELAAPADDAPGLTVYLPGQRPPWVDGACLATVRAHVLPEAKALALLQEQELGAWWRGYALATYQGRLEDRAACEASRATLQQEAQRARRWWLLTLAGVPVAAVGGYAVGRALP